MNRNIETFEHKIHIYHPNDQTESGVWGKVLTRCQSGKWSTLGGRGRLDPCAPRNHAVKARKKVSTDLWSFFCLKKIFFYNFFYKFVSIIPFSASKLCLHLLPLLAPARSHCPLHSQVSPAAPGCLWAPVCCGCGFLAVQGSPSRTTPHGYSAIAFEWPSPGSPC